MLSLPPPGPVFVEGVHGRRGVIVGAQGVLSAGRLWIQVRLSDARLITWAIAKLGHWTKTAQ